MFGSDWPQIETFEFNSYPNMFNVARAFVTTKKLAAMEKVFWRNSRKAYRWGTAEPSQRQT
jgi:predicted TIM-barrel fold metal-dependent hydrolase